MTYEMYLEDGELTHSAWTRALREGVLLGKACSDCGYVTAAPKAACTRCGSPDAEIVELPTEGEVYAETTVFVPPKAFMDQDSYGVGLVDLGDTRVMAQLEEGTEIGDPVELQGTIDQDVTPGPLFG
jgi:uncharacterized OB-fold protein